ncbi:MAG: hypothetical protein ACKO23_05070 [Gemmataceae bacterium]
MPRSSSRKTSYSRKQMKSEIREFLTLLRKVQPEKAAMRLQADMTCDAALELCDRMLKYTKRLEADLERARRKSRKLRKRFTSLVRDVTHSNLAFPRPGNLPAPNLDQLVQAFLSLRDKRFPELARSFERAGKNADAQTFQRFLVEQILLDGKGLLCSQLLHYFRDSQSTEDCKPILSKLGKYIGSSMRKILDRKSDLRLSPDLSTQLDQLVELGLSFLLDLITGQPSARLLLPERGGAFQADAHEIVPGSPLGENLVVRAILFPGLVLPGEGKPTVLHKAQVTTRQVASSQRP